ncbi:hypothetical protein TRFO_38916 [Tritrichomonas foetus]|uniref:E3 ubiquitin protein ligase n=1 Tax=Tritrichomonas foetus TaxID=1144522 RepID=A0A1J4J9L5_9EUKA|nr:hypothetical protein TRFO_38916 [Tritrichomonas foetus]|eukprot:OHS94919.1 hypothetical protein TRFO_38916 [Tritrichomonas foetus]
MHIFVHVICSWIRPHKFIKYNDINNSISISEQGCTLFMETEPSQGARSPDYASLEQHLVSLEKRKSKENGYNEDIATLIAYQHDLCSRLGHVHAQLSKVVPQGRRPFPVLPFSDLPINMVQTSQHIQLLTSISKLLWCTVSSPTESSEIFIRVHSGFNEMLSMRNNYLRMRPKIRPKTEFVEKSKDNKNTNTKKITFNGLNIDINRKEKLDTTFNTVTKKTYQELEALLGEDPTQEKVESVLDDLLKTEKELYAFLSELYSTQSNSLYFLKYPHLDIIQELPSFNEALSSIGKNTVEVRLELWKFTKTIAATLQYMKDVFTKFYDKCFSIPHIDFNKTKHLVNVEVQHYKALRRLNFFRQVTKSAKMKHPPEWSSLKFLSEEVEFYEEMTRLYKSNDIEQVKALLDDAEVRYESAEAEIRAEVKSVKESKKAADEASSLWYEKSDKKAAEQPDIKYLKQLSDARQNVEEKIYRNEKMREDCSGQLALTIERAKYLINEISDAPIIPLTFEDKMNKISDKEAKLNWLRSKANALKTDIENQKKEVTKLKEQSDKLDSQIQKKKTEFEEYQKKSRNEPVLGSSQSLEEYDEYAEKYYCYCRKTRSKERRRDVLLKECKHTFCSHCIQEQIKTRNRRCPYCGSNFSPNSDDIKINWEKKK